ncbi:MAG: hypothetical protein WCY59_07550 [Anaerovoracaceae bacterium]
MSELKRITEPGKYDVTIKNPHFEQLDEKNGDAVRMQCVLRGVTDDDQYIDAYLFFTRQIVTSGQHKGQPIYAVSSDKLIELGMSKPFSPSKIDEIDGVNAQFVVKEEEYNGKTKLTVQFINASRKKLDAKAANDIWASFTGEHPAPVADQDDEMVDDLGLENDNIPF